MEYLLVQDNSVGVMWQAGIATTKRGRNAKHSGHGIQGRSETRPTWRDFKTILFDESNSISRNREILRVCAKLFLAFDAQRQ
jgi:hypothetical protein